MSRRRSHGSHGRKCRGPDGGADITVSFGSVRQIGGDPIYLILNGDGLTSNGIVASSGDPLTFATYEATEDSNTVSVSASIDGNAPATRVNVIIEVSTATGVSVARTQALAMFEPFSLQTDIPLVIKAGQLVRVLADPAAPIDAAGYAGIVVVLRLFSTFDESDGEDCCSD
jgi:hypothetical protein